jgi:hypothetical protein
MPKPKKFNFEKPIAVVNDEEEATLAAFREDVRDAKATRTVPAEKARRLLRLWIADSSLRKAPTVLGLTPEQILATLPQARERVYARHYGERTQPAKSSARRQREK